MKVRLIKLSIYVLGLTLFQEVIFRVCFPLPELSNFDRGLYTEIDESKVKGYVRNRSYFWESSVDTTHQFQHHYNGYGFRDSEWKVIKEPGTERIIFFGDSYVESVMSDSTMTQYFRSTGLKDNLEVMNASMLGVGLTRYLRLLTDMVPVFKPHVAVMVVYANDFKYGQVDIPEFYLTPDHYNKWIPRVVELFNQWRRGTPVPFAWLQQANPLFAKAGQDGFAWNEILPEMTEHAEPFLVEAMKAGTFNHHRMNELMREEAYLKQERNLLVPIDYLKYYAGKFNFQPIVVYVPSRNQVTDHYLSYEHELCKTCDRDISLTDSVYNQNQQYLADVCQRLDIPFLDLSSFISTQEQMGNHLYWNYDGHLNEIGTKLVAERIYAFHRSDTNLAD